MHYHSALSTSCRVITTICQSSSRVLYLGDLAFFLLIGQRLVVPVGIGASWQCLVALRPPTA